MYMKLLKIKNLLNQFGAGKLDYKGLDIEQFIAGSQAYMKDSSFCIIATTEEEIVEHEDIVLLNDVEYGTLRDQIEQSYGTIVKPTDQERLALLEAAFDEILLGGVM